MRCAPDPRDADGMGTSSVARLRGPSDDVPAMGRGAFCAHGNRRWPPRDGPKWTRSGPPPYRRRFGVSGRHLSVVAVGMPGLASGHRIPDPGTPTPRKFQPWTRAPGTSAALDRPIHRARVVPGCWCGSMASTRTSAATAPCPGASRGSSGRSPSWSGRPAFRASTQSPVRVVRCRRPDTAVTSGAFDRLDGMQVRHRS